ncbi:MAG: NAD(+)/NADH kinase [Gemmatimonadaceae bacterium]
MRVGVVGHRGYDGLTDVLGRLTALARRLDITLAFEPELHAIAKEHEVLTDPRRLDALLTLGGDGTLLRGARALDGLAVPILGINLGRLGFLTSCGVDDLEAGVERLAHGDFHAERRMTLDVRALDAVGMERMRWFALNDVVLHKGGFARMVSLDVAANGESIASYSADGIVVATPTGSTAYNLSAGGPIVYPTVESIILTPISPHTMSIRSLVLPPSAEVTLRAEDGPEELLVTVDGQVGTTFARGETLVISRSERAVQIVRFPGTSFFARMRLKLGWGGLVDRDERREERLGAAGDR